MKKIILMATISLFFLSVQPVLAENCKFDHQVDAIVQLIQDEITSNVKKSFDKRFPQQFESLELKSEIVQQSKQQLNIVLTTKLKTKSQYTLNILGFKNAPNFSLMIRMIDNRFPKIDSKRCVAAVSWDLGLTQEEIDSRYETYKQAVDEAIKPLVLRNTFTAELQIAELKKRFELDKENVYNWSEVYSDNMGVCGQENLSPPYFASAEFCSSDTPGMMYSSSAMVANSNGRFGDPLLASREFFLEGAFHPVWGMNIIDPKENSGGGDNYLFYVYGLPQLMIVE